jgi:hypothetical protein
MMRLEGFRASFIFLWLLLLDPRLLRVNLRIVWSDVTSDVTMMAGRQASCSGMLHGRYCRFNVSILTRNNNFLTFVLTWILRLCNFRLHKDNLRRRGNVRNIRNKHIFIKT